MHRGQILCKSLRVLVKLLRQVMLVAMVFTAVIGVDCLDLRYVLGRWLLPMLKPTQGSALRAE